jgi:L-asparaginase
MASIGAGMSGGYAWGMQTIYLITTGGTIEKEYSEQLGVVLNNESKISQYLKSLRLPDCDVRITPLMNKDSLEMTPEDRAILIAELKRLLALNCPVVITHGTDTLVESGLLVERTFPALHVPVVFTGAMKPLGFDMSDGLQNLTESLLAARLLKPGVYVAMHGQVFPVSRTRKDRERGTFVRTDSGGERTEGDGQI